MCVKTASDDGSVTGFCGRCNELWDFPQKKNNIECVSKHSGCRHFNGGLCSIDSANTTGSDFFHLYSDSKSYQMKAAGARFEYTANVKIKSQSLLDCKKKGKSVPLQPWTGPEGSRKLSFPDFMTTAQDGGRLSALRTGRLHPRKSPWYPSC